MNNPLTNLHRFIAESFDLEELRLLCFDLSVVYDDLGGEGRSGKARELLLRMGRRRELKQLVDALQKERPGAFDEAQLGLVDGVDALYDALPKFEVDAALLYQQDGRDHIPRKVQLFIPGDLLSFSVDRRDAVIDALAGLLRIPSQAIEVYSIYEGSIIFDLGLPTKAIERLCALLQSNNARLRLLGIEKVIIETSSVETETWTVQEGKFGLAAQANATSTRRRRGSGVVRETGTVKWFNATKGYGFIERDAGGDIFVHHSDIRAEGFRSLDEGQRVEFSIVPGDEDPSAKDVTQKDDAVDSA